MNKNYRCFVLLLAVLFSINSYAAKTVKIKLTGSIFENVLLQIGKTGRSEVISDLPYTFELLQSELPVKLRFQSDSFIYHDIDIPEKPFDTTGHVYLVKVNETAMAMRGSNPLPVQPIIQKADTEKIAVFDVNKGVNAAPITNVEDEKSFALIITNEKYDLAANVDNATNDGLAFKEYCTKTLGIPTDNVKHYTNVSFGKMRKAVSDMLDLVDLLNGEGNLIIYYAGHGIPDNKSKDAFLMPTDADGTDTDICISLADLYNRIESKNLNRCVVFLDACFSGAQRGGEMILSARGVKLKPKEITPTGKTIVFSATSDDEAAYSHKGEDHGLFTYFLLKKLQESKGKVSLGELADYLSNKVAFESRRINNSAQTPRVVVSVGLEDRWKSIKLIK